MKTARLNIVLEPDEKVQAEQLAAAYGRRTGTEMTLSSYVRYLLRQAAVDASDTSALKQQRLPLPATNSPNEDAVRFRVNNWKSTGSRSRPSPSGTM